MTLILSWFNTGIKIFKYLGGPRGPQTCICYPTVTGNYLRSSALISSPTAWSLLFMKGNRLENEKFFFFFSFEFICCTFPFVCEQKMEEACTCNFFLFKRKQHIQKPKSCGVCIQSFNDNCIHMEIV